MKCHVRLPKVLTCQEFLKHPSLVTYSSSRQTGGYFDFAHLLSPELRRRRVQNLHGQTRYISTLVLWFSWALDWVVFRVRSRCGYVLPKTCWGTSSRSCPRFRYSGSWGRKNIQRPGHLCNSGSLQLQVLGLSLIKKQNDRSASLKPFARVFGDGCSSDVFPHQLTPWGPTSQSDPLKRVGRRAKATRTRLETMLDHSSGKSWFVAGCSWNGPYKAMWAMCSLQIMCLKWQYSWTLLGSKAFFVAKSEIQKPGPPMNAKKPLDLHKQFVLRKFPMRKLDTRSHGDGWRKQSPEERQNESKWHVFGPSLNENENSIQKSICHGWHETLSPICKVWMGLFNHGSLCLFGTFGDPHLHQGRLDLLEQNRQMRSFLRWGSFF